MTHACVLCTNLHVKTLPVELRRPTGKQPFLHRTTTRSNQPSNQQNQNKRRHYQRWWGTHTYAHTRIHVHAYTATTLANHFFRVGGMSRKALRFLISTHSMPHTLIEDCNRKKKRGGGVRGDVQIECRSTGRVRLALHVALHVAVPAVSVYSTWIFLTGNMNNDAMCHAGGGDASCMSCATLLRWTQCLQTRKKWH